MTRKAVRTYREEQRLVLIKKTAIKIIKVVVAVVLCYSLVCMMFCM